VGAIPLFLFKKEEMDMSHPYIHAESSVKLFGGAVEDYLPLHNWFDETKAWHPDWRHRAFRHHTECIQWCIEKFGEVIVNSDGKEIATLELGNQHVIEDVGFIPHADDWFEFFSEGEWHAFRMKRLSQPTELHDEMPHVMNNKVLQKKVKS